MFKRSFSRYISTRLIGVLTRHPVIFLLGGLLYIILPIDLFPEAATGFLGFVDDVMVMTLSLYLMNTFKNRQRASSDSPQKTSASPFEVLDIPITASQKEIQDAYRKKMAEYHPDKVAHLGPDLKKLAEEKTKEIQTAYHTLKNK
jgi:uncharacterized membrane protein YkvA (DUF1232 family)